MPVSVTVTRKQLYDRVWAEPVDAVAKQYGLSNVGLGKACRRHGIPVPPRGHVERDEHIDAWFALHRARHTDLLGLGFSRSPGRDQLQDGEEGERDDQPSVADAEL